ATAELGLGAGAGQFGLGPGQGGAVGALVDHEQHLVLLHLLAFLVGDAFDVTGHARPQLYGLHRLDAAGELAPGPELALRHFGHADFRRRRHAIAGGGLAAAAGCNGQRGQAEQAKCPAQGDLADGTRVSVLPVVARVHGGRASVQVGFGAVATASAGSGGIGSSRRTASCDCRSANAAQTWRPTSRALGHSRHRCRLSWPLQTGEAITNCWTRTGSPANSSCSTRSNMRCAAAATDSWP